MALDRILFGNEGQPTGPQAAWMQGMEDTYYKSMRDFQLQQAAEKQKSDIEEARLRNQYYKAQTDAQMESALASKDLRQAQTVNAQAQAEDRKRQQSYAHLAVLRDMLGKRDTVGAANYYNSVEEGLPQEYRSPMSKQNTFQDPATRQEVLSRLNPEVVQSLAKYADRTKGMFGLDQGQQKIDAQAKLQQEKLDFQRWQTQLQENTKLQIADMRNKLGEVVAKLKNSGQAQKLEAIHTGYVQKITDLQVAASTTTDPKELAQIQSQLALFTEAANTVAQHRQAAEPTPLVNTISNGAIGQTPGKAPTKVETPKVNAAVDFNSLK